MSDAKQFVLMERDGSDVYFHGCVTIPEGKDDSDVARIYRKVMDEERGDVAWTYEDIIAALTNEGFEYVPTAQFWEHDAYALPYALQGTDKPQPTVTPMAVEDYATHCGITEAEAMVRIHERHALLALLVEDHQPGICPLVCVSCNAQTIEPIASIASDPRWYIEEKTTKDEAVTDADIRCPNCW